MTEPKNALLNELVTFIQNDIPGFEDGEYQLTVSQTVVDSSGEPISTGDLENSYTFAVLGDRFRLAQPAQTVYSVFPPDNESGEYGAVLPHVVLTKATMPWARYPTSRAPSPGPGDDLPPWLTILILDEDDQAAFDQLTLEPVLGQTGDFFPRVAFGDSTLGDGYSYFRNATDTSQLEPGQAPDDAIQYIDVPLALFWQIAPTLADLAYMAHVRQVSLLQKPTIAGVSDVGEPVGKFSVVFGNRLPQTGKKSYAHLISLEELEPFLPDDPEGGPPAGNSFDGARNLRLAVLKSWSFLATGQSATFVDQMLALNKTASGPEITTLQLPYSGQNQQVADALSMGYVPLDTDLRTGEKTISWYRGPLAPYPVTTGAPTLPIASPDQASIFDPTTGMLDQSLAAAWTIGRMIALQDTSFSVPLYKWKKTVTRNVVIGVEEEILQEKMSALSLSAGQRSEGARPPSAQLIHGVLKSLQPR